MAARKLISVVTPCFNEQDNIRLCYEAVKKVFDDELTDYDFEHIFCDNASTDRTPEVLTDLAGADRRVKVIFNARNFGPFRSMFNGIIHTSGAAVLLFLPADLQDPPELLPQFVRQWEEGHEVVYGVRHKREESWLMQTVRRLYYRTLHGMANIDIPPDVGEFQLVDRKVIVALRQCDDFYPYVRGLVAHCGFKTTAIKYQWKARARGFSKNRLYHLVDQGLNGLVSFTNVPMRLCLFFGMGLALFSCAYALFTFIYHLCIAQTAPPGTPTLICALFFFSGIQMFFAGVLGEYVSAIHSQVRKRPTVVERDRLNFDRTQDDARSRTAA
jgi:glycosyltransferase involved in cell wall biosynthesis